MLAERATDAHQASDHFTRASAEIITGVTSGSVGIAWWFHFLQDVNIALATVSLFFGCVVGGHGTWRLIRGYVRRHR